MKKILFVIFMTQLFSCKDSYDLPVSIPATGYLVIDGAINSGQGETVIYLSKSVRLVDSFNVNYVTNANVFVEGQDNSRIQLSHRGRGEYVHTQLSLNRSQQYRLRINQGGKEYLSKFMPVKQSPVIDSISWDYDPAGVHIYMDAKGNANTSGYYRWDYSEAWEFHSSYAPNLRYNTDPRAGYIYVDQIAFFKYIFC
ncbi:MAG: DUF4249 domain-containing protein, partial [Chitinophagaceae bacterium]